MTGKVTLYDRKRNTLLSTTALKKRRSDEIIYGKQPRPFGPTE